MKNPVDVVKGRIVSYDPRTRVATIKAVYPDLKIFEKRRYAECEVRLLDGRTLSDKQRKAIYSLLREISRETGQDVASAKEELKRRFLDEYLCEPEFESFSLSDVSMSMACSFQRYLVRFILEYDIPCSFPLLEFADDQRDYLYSCLLNRKCCICGRTSDLHHISHVGIGRGREDIIHEGLEVLPLCRAHHGEAHKIGQKTFNGKYHLNGGIALDKYLCNLYKLNTKEESEYAESLDGHGTAHERP
jgi:hypothetical protein